jgi:hypothetical protein
VEIGLVKRPRNGDADRAYLTVGGQTRRGPIHAVHDLPHLVVESVFEIDDGLWAELAAGGHAAAARTTTARDPARRKSGRIVSGAATGARTDEWLSSGHRLAKIVTNAVVNRWGDGPDTPAGVRRRLARQAAPDVEALMRRINDEQIATAISGVRTLDRRWMATPPGGTLHLMWPLPSSALR